MKLFRRARPRDITGGALSVPQSDTRNEKCVACGKDTGVPHGTPLKGRKRYISGSGQLCRDCYRELYLQADTEIYANPTATDMEKLLKMSRKE